MEVKIKNNGEMLDATIEMVDGIMVVSPKVELFEPENGDIVTTKNGQHIFLCKDYIGECYIYAYLGYDFITHSWFKEGEWVAERYATEEEKKKFFDKLAEEGLGWKSDTKKLVKLKWKPESGDIFYRPSSTYGRFDCYKTSCNHSGIDKTYISKGWAFKTQEDCQSFCDKLNQAIKTVKP